MPFYGGTYVVFIAIEFALYETVLREIENRCEGKSVIGHTLAHFKQLQRVIQETANEMMHKANIMVEVIEEASAPKTGISPFKRMQRPPKEYGIIDEFEESDEKQPHSHHTSDVLLCGVLSGAVAGFMTNGMETLAVKKQTDRKFSITKLFQKRGAIWHTMFAGARYRTVYYGMQGLLFFGLLEYMKQLLNVETMED